VLHVQLRIAKIKRNLVCSLNSTTLALTAMLWACRSFSTSACISALTGVAFSRLRFVLRGLCPSAVTLTRTDPGNIFRNFHFIISTQSRLHPKVLPVILVPNAPSVRSIYGLFPGFFTGHHSG
ncbi:MAG: hypothetical protein ACLTZH_11525, partial [Subdoligranulum sp.]